jgi:hypothetical protein
MTFLQLVNQLRVECGVSGPPLTTVAGQLAGSENARMVTWIQTAWNDIQTSKEDWLFLREPFQFNTVSLQQIYTPVQAGLTTATFGNWKRDSFRCSSVGSNYTDEQLLNYMEWTTFRNLYIYANMRNTYTRPVVVTVDPHKNLGFGAIPDIPYVIVGEYYTQPVELTVDGDEPAIPSRFHMIIVYRAMMYYAGYEAAPEVMSRGEFEYKRLSSRFDIDQIPTVVSGPPLA